MLCRPDDKFSVSLNVTSIAELEALRLNVSDVFSSKNTDTLETEIELEKHIGDDIVKVEVETEGGGNNNDLQFNSDAVFNSFLLGISDIIVADVKSNFKNVTKVKRELEVEENEVGLASQQDEIEVMLKMKPDDGQSLIKSDVEAARVLFDDTLEARDTIVNATRGNLIERYEEGPKTEFIIKDSAAEINMGYKGILVGNKQDVKSKLKTIVNEEYTNTMIQNIKDKLYENSTAVTTEVEIEVKKRDDSGDDTSAAIG